MLISNILFFIECVEQLKPSYKKTTYKKQKKQLATFLKTWIWYNSDSESIFWTGLSSDESENNKRAKEHWYSNLTTAEYLLKNGIHELSKSEQILWIFQRMQWNYTSKKENKNLIPNQRYIPFYETFNGDPKRVYESIGISLNTIKTDILSKKIEEFILQKRRASTIIAEIGFGSNEYKRFFKGLEYAKEENNSKFDLLKISDKNIVIQANSFSQLFQTIMAGLWSIMDNNEVLDFIDENQYDYQISRGPFRKENTFETQKHRVFPVKNKNGIKTFMTTYNNNQYKLSLIEILSEYLDVEISIYDHQFEEFLP